MARGSGSMRIEKIYLYPIKSFRAIELDSATLTKHGFPYDRTFMLLRAKHDKESGEKKFVNMSVAENNEMVRFFPSINHDTATITVTFYPVDTNSPKKTLDIPLEPDISNLEEVDVVMHLSPTKAYRMPDHYNDWLSSCFGYEVILTYISDNLREVRMTNNKWKSNTVPQPTGWISTLTSKASALLGTDDSLETSAIRFSDVAPYLFVSSKSMEDIHPRLPEGEEMDITKFRPNIVVSGADKPWEEDYWGELAIGPPGQEGTKIALEQNCGRCVSINVDYATGAQGKGESGTVLKKLMKDRRIDKGNRWSPIVGRYGFLPPESEGRVVRVGDEVTVTRVNEEGTVWDWEGLSTLPGGGRDTVKK